MKIFAIGAVCPITKKEELFPRNCTFTNIQVGKKHIQDAFPELKCAYLEIKLDPKNKRVSYKCCHPGSIMCMDDKKTYAGKKE